MPTGASETPSHGSGDRFVARGETARTRPARNRNSGRGNPQNAVHGETIAIAHTYTSLYYHAIFSTKDHHPFIVDANRDRLYGYIGGILDQRDGRSIRAGGTADHIHLLFQMPTSTSLAENMRAVKATSFKWIHETFPDSSGFSWQIGYAAFTVSHSVVPKVAAYIENQEEHHGTQTFEDEYKAFLDRHGIDYDDRFVFG